jgi:hypothetical protein
MTLPGRPALAIAAVVAALVPDAPAAAQEPLGPACPSQVMAFYYQWYGGPPEWRHWGSPDRGQIVSTDYPKLGPYDSRKKRVIDRHLRWAERAGIDVLVTSWWGPGSWEDRALGLLLDRIEKTRSRVRVAVYLETWALFYGGQLSPGFFLDPRNFSPDERELIRERAAQWIAHVLTVHGDRRGFARATKGGARVPLVFVYFAGLFDPLEWQEIFARARELSGRDAFYHGDVEGADPQLQARAFDGIHVYMPAPYTAEGDLSLAARVVDPNAAVHLPGSSVTDVATLGSDYRVLAAEARAQGRSWAATVIPGFDDHRVRNPSFVVSRDRDGERTYDFMWRDVALPSRPDWVLITSFNEWHEGSEIEPSVEYGDEFLTRTRAWARYARACRRGTR